jgi:hypothetical protein
VSDPARRSIAEMMGDRALVDAAIERGVREAVLKHARLGQPVPTLKDGKVVWLSPEEVFALLGESANGRGQP